MSFRGLTQRERSVKGRPDPTRPNLVQTPLQILRVREDRPPKLFLREKELRTATLIVASAPAVKPYATMMPNGRTASMVLANSLPPTLSIATSTPCPPDQPFTRSTTSSFLVLITKSTPSDFTYSPFTSSRTVVATLAPNALAT